VGRFTVAGFRCRWKRDREISRFSRSTA
jgi:hypothetical protein